MDSYRILFFVSSLRSGGAENHLLNLCRYLKKYGWKPAVCTLSPGEDGLESMFLLGGVSLFRLPLSSLKDLAAPRTILALRRIVKGWRPDIIHGHLYHAEVVSAVASLFTDAPLLATRHSAGLEFEGRRRWAVRLMRSRFDFLITVSGEAADEAAAMGYAGSRVATVPNGIDTGRFRPPEGPGREERKRKLLKELFQEAGTESCLIVGTLGGLKPVKNFALFVRMAARLMRRRRDPQPPVKFLIVGEGAERESLTGLAGDLGMTSMIAMPGYRDRPEDVCPLFDIFVLPSLSEGVPMALLEAMASGVACVASDVGGIGEIVADAGMLVEPGDEDGFVAAVGDLLENGSKRGELARKARIRIIEHYDIEIWGDRIMRIYRSLLDRYRGG